jgi:hypothetical protein
MDERPGSTLDERLVLQIKIKPSWSEYARDKETHQRFNGTTILDFGSGQYVGMLGEIALGTFLRDVENISFEHCGFTSYDCDFIAGGLKIDVKTKACNTPPLPHYTVHVTESQKDRDCDIYVFCRASPDTVYLLGWIPKADFWSTDLGVDSRGGQADYDGFIERADARKLKVSDLLGMELLAGAIESGVTKYYINNYK